MGSYAICGIISFRNFQWGNVTFIHVFQSTAPLSEAQKQHPDAHARSYDHQQKGQTDPKLWTAEYWRWCCWLSHCTQVRIQAYFNTVQTMKSGWSNENMRVPEWVASQKQKHFPHWTLGGARLWDHLFLSKKIWSVLGTDLCLEASWSGRCSDHSSSNWCRIEDLRRYIAPCRCVWRSNPAPRSRVTTCRSRHVRGRFDSHMCLFHSHMCRAASDQPRHLKVQERPKLVNLQK